MVEWLDAAGTWIKNTWGVLAAITGICGVIYKYGIAPYLKKRKEHDDKLDATLKEQTDALKDLKDSVKELSTDVGFLQHDRLTQGHDHFMKLGYIPSHDKENLIAMYDRYIAKERNSLFKTYKDDLLGLPPAPDIPWGKRPGRESA